MSRDGCYDGSMSEYKAGTVAAGKIGSAQGTLLRGVDGWYYVASLADGGVDVGWCRDTINLATDIRPLVLLDLSKWYDEIGFGEPSNGVLARLRMVASHGHTVGHSKTNDLIGHIADQIEEQTKPPKPAEPKGLGAVVEDGAGRHWIRVPQFSGYAGPWFSENGEATKFSWSQWGDMDAVKVLSEGVDV